MKTIKEIQEENRKLIILANNKEAKSYEEALGMELGFGCVIELKRIIGVEGFNHKDIFIDWLENNNSFRSLCTSHIYKECNINRIMGKPLTLDRVLIAIKQVCGKEKYHTGFALLLKYSEIFYIEHELDDSMTSFGKWDLTKPTLEEQTQQTQIEINKLLTK